MTEKRYVLFNHKNTDYILDNPNTSLDFIEMLGDSLSSEEIVGKLNAQNDCINQFKELITSLNNRYDREYNYSRELLSEKIKLNDLITEQDDKLKELLNSINNRIKFWEEVAKQDPSNFYFSRLLNDLNDLRRLYYE